MSEGKVIQVGQKLRFILVGGLNTIIGFLSYFLFLYIFEVNYTLSLFISHVIGVINSYFWNKNYTFNVKKGSKGMILKFIFLYFSTFLINYAILTLLVEIVKINPIISQLVSLTITTIVSFIGQKYWSFKEKNIMESGR